MGNCMSAPGASAAARERTSATDAVEAVTKKFRPDVDGESHHLHVKATKSGRMLLGTGDQPMSSEQLDHMKTVLEEDPATAQMALGLLKAADMGLQVSDSGAPAFFGLLVARVVSASIQEYKNPLVQFTCEDDKSKPIPHNTAGKQMDRSSTSSSVPPPGSQGEEDGATGPQDLQRQNMSLKVRDFTWDRTFPVPFVVVFSHAALTLSLRESGFGGPGHATGMLSIADLQQGTTTYTVPMKLRGNEIGHVVVEIDYNWQRGTIDNGSRVGTTRISINQRKLKNPLAVVSRVSNVNHWLLSHDNVWPALPKNHPALRDKNSRDSESAATGQKMLSLSDNNDPTVADTLLSESSTDASQIDLALQGSAKAQHAAIAEEFADVEGCNKLNGCARLFEYSINDALATKNGDTQNMVEVKSQMTSLFTLLNQRLATLEDTVTRQQDLIMELSYQIDRKENGPMLPYVSGKFGYGLGRPASKRKVLLFAHRTQYLPEEDKFSTAFLGEYKTEGNGSLGPVPIPDSMITTPGHYDVLALLPQDNTFARGSLFVLAPKTKCVLFDLDGTITVGDQQVVAQFALNAFAASTDVGDRLLTQAWDQKSRAHARTLCRLWAAKGYQVVYLSGRQGSFYNLTLQWLIKHHFPPGPIHLTRTHVPTLPLYVSVGNFKLQYMESLKRKGFELFAAYGNTGTDVRAYEAAGIPKSRTFTIGQAAGSGGTQRVKNWTWHMKDVLAIPDADVPVPYVDLVPCSVPSYNKKSSGSAGSKRENLASATCGQMPTKASPYQDKEEFSQSTVSTSTEAVDLPIEAEVLDTSEVADMYEDDSGEDGAPPPVVSSVPVADELKKPVEPASVPIQEPLAAEPVS